MTLAKGKASLSPSETKKINYWKLFVRFMIDKDAGKTPLKELLKNYSKEEYKKFRKNPRVYI